MRTLLLFDIDGTLVNSEGIILTAQSRAFAALGLPAPSRERGLSIVGLSLTEAFEVLAGKDGPIEALTEAYRQAFFGLRQEGGELESLFVGAGELVASLHQGGRHVLGIATGKSQRGVQAIIETYRWQGIFQTVQTSDDAPSKPHPGMIQNACRQTGIAPAQTLMIGDSSFDMRMAKAAGAQAIAVSWGFQPVEALRDAGADHVVESFAELAELIDRAGSH